MTAALVKIIVGFILDLCLGDPQGAPHPVRLIGALIGSLEKMLRRRILQRLVGVFLLCIVIVAVYGSVRYLAMLSWALEIFFIYTVLATRSLAVEALKIYKLLAADDLDEARRQVSFLVSRDTDTMNRAEIIRATVETVTENIVDGVIAPLCYLFAGGAPLAMTYKAVNTLDSMVGYKNEKYLRFGWASARFDDVLNFIPARLTGFFLIPVAAFFVGGRVCGAYRVLLRDRRNHSSPNSGHPEAAAAGALGVRLGGVTSYFGVLHNKPYIGDSQHEFEIQDIVKAVRLLYATAGVGLCAGIVIVVSVRCLF
jgi:adenosylcobinamide-phosphate synthase